MGEEERELYWYDDATYDIGFYNYYQRTVDPSPWAFVVSLLFCIGSAMLLPRYLAYYRSVHASPNAKTNTNANTNAKTQTKRNATASCGQPKPSSVVMLGSQAFVASDEDPYSAPVYAHGRGHGHGHGHGHASSHTAEGTKIQGHSSNSFLPSVNEELTSGRNAESQEVEESLEQQILREKALQSLCRFVHPPEGETANGVLSKTGQLPSPSTNYTSMEPEAEGSNANKANPLGYSELFGNDETAIPDRDAGRTNHVPNHHDKPFEELFYREAKDNESSCPSSAMSDTTNPFEIIRNDYLDFTRNVVDPKESLSVASGWEEFFDPALQHTIYFHPATGLRTAEKPVESIPKSVRPWYLFYLSSAFRRKIRKCRRWDDELEKIIGLVLPYTAHTIVVDVFGLLEVAIIGRVLGTTQLSAYFATEFAISFATMFFHGILASLKVLVSQAHGANNLQLAGNYVQIGIWTHHLFSLPLVLYGWNHFDDVVLRLGLDEETAESADQYARFALIYEAIGVYDGALHCVLDVTGHEKYSAISNGVRAFCSFLTVLTVSVVLTKKRAKLWMVGAIHLIVKVLLFAVNIGVIVYKKWLHDYWTEMARTSPFGNRGAIKSLWKASLRLSSGRVIEDCEWNIMFVFAAIQGPAEVAIWGLVGKLWDFADNIVIAVSDASKVRCAQLLGSGLPEQAKYSSEKSLFIGVVVSIVLSVSLGALRSVIPRWLTNDFTLQRLLGDTIPLVCLAVATLSFGSICWSILCAQGRSHLATAVTGFGSLVVALPLASLSNFCFNLNLQGLIASLIMGYATSGFCNSVLMLTSNWTSISRKVRKRTSRIDVQVVETIGNNNNNHNNNNINNHINNHINTAIAKVAQEMEDEDSDCCGCGP